MTEIERRVAAVEATWKKFRGRPFALGTTDCVKIGAWHLRKMGRRPSGIAKAGRYSTPVGARRALARAGFESIADALAKMGLREIAPAAALPGDILLAPGGAGLEALTIVAGNGMVIGFFDDMLADGVQRIRITAPTATRAFRA